jgi:light-harvesting complex I chlorophyll a/b binding protein 3
MYLGWSGMVTEGLVFDYMQTTRVGGKLFFPDEASAKYLDGTHAGDLGFDPLGLCDPDGPGGFVSPEWLRYGEIINGRWAMLGCAGCIAPELLGKAGLIPEATNVIWWKSGVIPPVGTPDGLYWADPWAIFWIEVVLMQFAELRRWQDYNKPGSMGEQYFLGLENFLKGSGEPAYPGVCHKPQTTTPQLHLIACSAQSK